MVKRRKKYTEIQHKNLLKVISGAEEPGQGSIGLFVGEQGGKTLVHGQGFQGQFQMTLVSQNGKTVAFPVTGQAAMGLLHGICGVNGPHPDTHPGCGFPI